MTPDQLRGAARNLAVGSVFRSTFEMAGFIRTGRASRSCRQTAIQRSRKFPSIKEGKRMAQMGHSPYLKQSGFS